MADFWIDSYFDPDYFAEGYFGADDTGIVPAELSGTATGGSTVSGTLSLRLASRPVVFGGLSFRDLLPTPARISVSAAGGSKVTAAISARAGVAARGLSSGTAAAKMGAAYPMAGTAAGGSGASGAVAITGRHVAADNDFWLIAA